jgi:hypothetical protein
MLKEQYLPLIMQQCFVVMLFCLTLKMNDLQEQKGNAAYFQPDVKYHLERSRLPFP